MKPTYAEVAQLAEQRSCKPPVAGSTPVLGSNAETTPSRVSYTNKVNHKTTFLPFDKLAGVMFNGSIAGFQPARAGSTPVTRSNVDGGSGN